MGPDFEFSHGQEEHEARLIELLESQLPLDRENCKMRTDKPWKPLGSDTGWGPAVKRLLVYKPYENPHEY